MLAAQSLQLNGLGEILEASEGMICIRHGESVIVSARLEQFRVCHPAKGQLVMLPDCKGKEVKEASMGQK